MPQRLAARIALRCAASLLFAAGLAHLGRGAADDARLTTSRVGARPLDLPREDAGAFTFAVFGDRTGGPAEGVRVLAQAVDEVNLLQPDLVMTVGDLVEGYNTTPEWLVQMQEFRGIMDRLAMPWFPVPGNHDVYWRGPGRPAREHEESYERHFGPLWYAFRHKGCAFIALYADETSPETGEKRFDDPLHQRMSPEQFAWLEATLASHADARHVFLFLHHPRWIGGSYGDEWERVHALLLAAGNVTAVFAGHIHHMRYDPRDGIEYYALATVGGVQEGDLPEAGYLHQYSYVTVRDTGIATVSYPVGTARDPRRITGRVASEARRATKEFAPETLGRVAFDPAHGATGEFRLRLKNPLADPLELALAAVPGDARWSFEPEHAHLVLPPDAEETLTWRLARAAGALDEAFALPELHAAADLLLPELRVPLPDARIVAPLAPAGFPRPAAGVELALALDGADDCLTLPAQALALADGPFTLEAWVRPRELSGRRAVASKAEQSEFGLFASDAKPSFSVHLNGAYASAESDAPLASERWQHLAGVYDGARVALYVEGELRAEAPASGARTPNRLPLVVGGDVDAAGRPTAVFHGALDELRLSRGARYQGERFTPSRRFASDADTLLLLHMDARLGPWIEDASPAGNHPLVSGGAELAAER
jgi:hypothetical protein